MSLFTDIRDNLEDKIGIGPNSDVAATVSGGISDLVSGAASAATSQTSTHPAVSAPAAATPTTPTPAVTAFKITAPIVIIAGLAAYFLFMRRK